MKNNIVFIYYVQLCEEDWDGTQCPQPKVTCSSKVATPKKPKPVANKPKDKRKGANKFFAEIIDDDDIDADDLGDVQVANSYNWIVSILTFFMSINI